MELQLQHHFLQLIFRVDFLSKGLLRVFASTTIQKHQFFGTQPSLWSNSYLCITTGKIIALTIRTFNIFCGLGLKKRGGPRGRRASLRRRRPQPNAPWAALRPPTIRGGRGRERWGRELPPQGVPEDFELQLCPPSGMGSSGGQAGPWRDAFWSRKPPGGAGSRIRPARVLPVQGP